MSLSEFASLLEHIPGFAGKVAMYAFPVDQTPELPIIIYLQTGVRTLAADDRIFYSAPIVEIELYTHAKDLVSESALEATFASAGLVWTKEEEYLYSERCYEVVYTVTL